MSNSLSPPGELHAGDELVSNNGYFTLHMGADGALSIFRNQTRMVMWRSPALDGGHAVMQGDGNFVLYAPDGHPYWATNTAGHPTSWLALLDNGDLQVLDHANPIWHSNSGQDMNAPSVHYVAEGGYNYDETSEFQKKICAVFPCAMAMQWPGYATTIVEDTLDGAEIVIQLWKGLCPKFDDALWTQYLPGGVGAEVGIYRRIPGKVIPTSFGNLQPGPLLQALMALSHTAAADLWWPAPDLGAELWMRFINPNTREVMFEAGPQTGYWLTKWMYPSDYRNYKRDHDGAANYTDYILEFTVNGKIYHHWPAEPGDLGARAQAGWLPLLLGGG